MTREETQAWWSWKVSLGSGFWSCHFAVVANLISILYSFIVVSSKVIPLYIYTYLILFRFFSRIGYYRTLSSVPRGIK